MLTRHRKWEVRSSWQINSSHSYSYPRGQDDQTKRKPDRITVNFVQSVPGKRSRNVRIRPESYSLPLSSTPNSSADDLLPANELELDIDNGEYLQPSEEPCSTGGSHQARKEKAAEAWENVRSKITPVIIAAFGFPNHSVCVFCNSTPAAVWCPDCTWFKCLSM